VYSLLLEDYSVNSDLTNNAAMKLLYSIASDLKMAPLLYHISIFTTLMAILNEPRVPRYKVSGWNRWEGIILDRGRWSQAHPFLLNSSTYVC